jgi:hypothetical protein
LRALGIEEFSLYSPGAQEAAVATTETLAFEIAGQTIALEMCRKDESFGSVTVDHWWLPITDLYGQRNRRGRPGNREAILRAYHALAVEEFRTDPDVEQSYLLARLVPEVRNQGSRRIFLDAFLHRSAKRDRPYLDELNTSIRSTFDRETDEGEFHRQTAEILGPPHLAPDVEAEYRKMEDNLFGPVRGRVAEQPEAAWESVTATWGEWMQTVARKAGHETTKQVLDVLSYEARAALHRVYSAVWNDLLSYLQLMYALSPESRSFLEFWHLDPCRPGDGPGYFHLFHGHVFGLHPAGAAFIQTAAGHSLLEQWLRHDTRPGLWTRLSQTMTASDRGAAAYRRLLNGLLIATFEYQRRLTDEAARRRR